MLPNVTKMLPKSVKSVKKSQKFYCECCDYYASQKSHLKKHLATQKHKKNMLPNVTKTLPKSVKSRTKVAKIFVCEHCNKEYKSRKGLWGHKKKCIPIIEKKSSLKFNKDFYAGYSPERINPGDKNHTLVNILKVTSGSNAEIAETVDLLYKSIIKAGTYMAPSIKVAEAA